MILSTLQKKSSLTALHSRRVGELCAAIGRAMNLPKREVNDLRLMGMMHDIGKISVDESILNKKGKLTEEEYALMKQHSEVGFRLLRASQNLSCIADFVLAHHERPDGSGYPRRLHNAQIPVLAKILAVADSFDAMTSDRPYRKAMPVDEAVAELRRHVGTQFDAHIVDVLVTRVICCG